MHVTVAICTWNRAKLLDQTLTQMRNLRIPEGITWELLVVNNNCTDGTDAVLDRHADVLPLRRLLERKQGLCNARNCAVAAATGELLLWTDDDVLVDPGWLAAYVRASREWPDAAVFGGQIDPWFETPPPQWIQRNLTGLHGPFVIMTGREADEPMARGAVPFGANMAFRTEVLRRFPFDPALGRCGKGMRGGDDTGKCEEILKAGHSGRWVRGARVQHFVVRKRLTAAYLYRYFCGHQETLAMLGPENTGQNVPWWAIRLWCESTVIRLVTAPLRTDAWFRAMRRAAFANGQIRGYLCRAYGATARTRRTISLHHGDTQEDLEPGIDEASGEQCQRAHVERSRGR
jgi:glucosyl-dolichyl phosphate glucuronosyltransferase